MPNLPRVLLVDDNKFVPDAYKPALERDFFQVEWEQDANSAIQRVKDNRYDWVVLDLEMPVKGIPQIDAGQRLADEILKLPAHPQLAVFTATFNPSLKAWFTKRRIPYFEKTLHPDALARGLKFLDDIARKATSLPCRTVPWTVRQPLFPRTRKASPDVVVVTATQTEYDALVELSGVKDDIRAKRTGCIDLGLPNCRAWALPCGMGNLRTALAVLKTLITLKPQPQVVISTGICCGLDPAQQSIGDLVLATSAYDYEFTKEGTEQTARGQEPTCSEELLREFQNARVSWHGKVAGATRPNLWSGVVLTGSKVVNSIQFVSNLLRRRPDAKALEMELGGVAVAAGMARVHWTQVKGICDWGIEKNDEHQSDAAKNAIDFVLHVLSSEGMTLFLRENSGR